MTRARGCAIGCLAATVAVGATVAFAAAIGFGVFGFMRSSEVVQEAVRRASEHPAVVDALGRPVEPRWWLTGSIQINGPSGHASLAIPLKGPKGAGTLYVEAFKRAGEWRYQTLELAPPSGPRIDLLPPAPAPPPGSPAGAVFRRTPAPDEVAAKKELERVRAELAELKRQQEAAAAEAERQAREKAERERRRREND